MSVIVTGSIATDYLMKYPGRFLEHILPEQGKISVSFLVEEKHMSRGGIGPNIAYTMALLGERPRLMGTVGQDFGDYRAWLEAQGMDTSLVVAYPGEFTATFTVITDLEQNQIAGFHAGAMSRGRELTYRGLDPSEIDYVIISPNDPEGMLSNCAECRELGIKFIFDPSQQLARFDGEQVLAGMAGAYALTVNDYELELVKRRPAWTRRASWRRSGCWSSPAARTAPASCRRERRVDVPVAKPSHRRSHRRRRRVPRRADHRPGARLPVGGDRPHRRPGRDLLPGAGGHDEPPLHGGRVCGAVPGEFRGRAGVERSGRLVNW